MGTTRIEKYAFTLLMCFFMVLGMTAYNIALADGLSLRIFSSLAVDLWLGFFVALALDVLLVGRIAKPLAFGILKGRAAPGKPLTIVTVTLCMVTGMVLCMSVFGAVVEKGFTAAAFRRYPTIAMRNFIMALPLNLIIVGPLSRFLFIRLFPETTR